MSNTFYLFKTRRFLPLFITQFLDAFNSNTLKNALLIWYTFSATATAQINSSILVSIAAGLFVLPFFLFSATAGQLADRYEQSALTKKIKFLEIVTMIIAAIGFFCHSVYGLLFVLFLVGTEAAFFGPIKYSLLPEHLAKHELLGGNSLIEGGTFLAILLGTIFGGLIIYTHYGIALLSFFLIAVAISGWRSSHYIPKTRVADPSLMINWNIIHATWKIIQFARTQRSVWLSIICISWFWFIGVTFLTQFPTYTKYILHGNDHLVTLFLTLFSIGIGIGSLVCNKLMRGNINAKLVPWSCLAMTLFIVDFCWASHGIVMTNQTCAATSGCEITEVTALMFLQTVHGWRIMFDLIMLAVFAGMYILPLYTIMQHRGNSQHMARIIATNNVMNSLFMVLSSIIALLLFALKFTVLDIFVSVGVANLLFLLVVRQLIKVSR